jgi:hypothetical protein
MELAQLQRVALASASETQNAPLINPTVQFAVIQPKKLITGTQRETTDEKMKNTCKVFAPLVTAPLTAG